MALADIRVDHNYITREITPALNLIALCRTYRNLPGLVFVVVHEFHHMRRCEQVLQARGTKLTRGVRANTNLKQLHHCFLNFFEGSSINEFTFG
jgi:hypothetical protein